MILKPSSNIFKSRVTFVHRINLWDNPTRLRFTPFTYHFSLVSGQNFETLSRWNPPNPNIWVPTPTDDCVLRTVTACHDYKQETACNNYKQVTACNHYKQVTACNDYKQVRLKCKEGYTSLALHHIFLPWSKYCLYFKTVTMFFLYISNSKSQLKLPSVEWNGTCQ